MKLTEKSFELNITHEILTRADQLRVLYQALLISRGSPISGHLAAIPHLSSVSAIGISLQDESKHGWDVRIQLPHYFSSPRCICIQYKLGEHKTSAQGSNLFRGNWRRRNPHSVFKINNNRRRDQHFLLRGLAADTRQSRAVYYALPRITTTGAFRSWIGRLSHMTTWLQISEVDNLAQQAGVNIQRGHIHRIRTSYDDSRRELRSTPIDISTLKDAGPELIAEITAIRVWRTLEDWAPIARESGIPTRTWYRIFLLYTTILRREWGGADDERLIAAEREAYVRDLFTRAVQTQEELGTNAEMLVDSILERSGRVLTAIDERLRPLALSVQTGEWLTGDVPEPRAQFTINLDQTEMWVRLAENSADDPDSVDWSALALQVV